MASNIQVDLRKTENFVGSKCYPEDISEVKERKLISENLVRSLKSFDGHLTCKGKRRVRFDNDRRAVHEGLGDEPKANVLEDYRGRESNFTGKAWLKM